MAKMAKWKGKTFQVSRKSVTAIEGMSVTYALKENEANKKKEKKHASKKKKLDPIEITIQTTLNANAGVNVKKEIKSWKKLIGSIDYIKIGGEKFGPKMQLKKVSVSNIVIDDRGRFRAAEMSLNFQQYKKNKQKTAVKSSAKKVKGSKDYKSTKSKKNKKLQQAKKKKKSVSKGSYITISGEKARARYVKEIPMSKKDAKRKHKVTKVDEGKNRVQITYKGKSHWISKSDITVSTSKK